MLLAQANAEGPGGKLVAVAESAEKPGGSGGVFFFVLSKLEGADIFIVAGIMLLLAMVSGADSVQDRLSQPLARRPTRYSASASAKCTKNWCRWPKCSGISPQEVKFLEGSPLARLYAIGISELRSRQKARREPAVAGRSGRCDAICR